MHLARLRKMEEMVARKAERRSIDVEDGSAGLRRRRRHGIGTRRS